MYICITCTNCQFDTMPVFVADLGLGVMSHLTALCYKTELDQKTKCKANTASAAAAKNLKAIPISHFYWFFIFLAIQYIIRTFSPCETLISFEHAIHISCFSDIMKL